MRSPLDHSSFSTLDENAQEAIRRVFDDQNDDSVEWDTLDIFRHRKSVVSSLSYYRSKLKTINPASFDYLDSTQHIVLHQELLFIFYLCSVQYHLDEVESRKNNRKQQVGELKHCAGLINKLRLAAIKSPERLEMEAMDDSEKYLKYLGLTIVAPLVADKMDELSSGKTAVAKQWLNELNDQRAYWARSSGLIISTLKLLPETDISTIHTTETFSMPSPLLSYMTWMVYYARFGLNLFLLLKHTIPNPWMSDEEKNKIPAWERFTCQWEQRRFSLINDAIYANLNMVCFYFLTGTAELIQTANLLTIGLMTLDLFWALWRFEAENTEYNRAQLNYTRDIAVLQSKIDALSQESHEKKLVEEQCRALIKAQQHHAREWRYKTYAQLNDFMYLVGLLVAFCLLSSFMFPANMLPVTALILNLTGAAVCFLVTIAHAAITQGIMMRKSEETKQLVDDELVALLFQFEESVNEFQKKQLYLDMKQLVVRSDYQEQLVYCQKLQLNRSLFFNTLGPQVVFMSLMLLPLGSGLAVLALGFALVLISDKVCKGFIPADVVLPEFKEADYLIFAEDPSRANLKEDALQDSSGFFPMPQGWSSSGASGDEADEQLKLDPV